MFLFSITPKVNTSAVEMIWSTQWNNIQDMASQLDNIAITNIPCGPVSLWTMMKATVLIGLLLIIYKRLLAPINRIKLLGDVGYIPHSGLTMKEMSTVVRTQRMDTHVPPVYPNGWFSVLESRDLGERESKAVSCLGKLVFRRTNLYSRLSIP